MTIKTILSAIILVFTASVIVEAQCAEKAEFPKLCTVKKIYVGELGSNDEVERFRYLFIESLTDEGFIIVESPDQADAIMTGIVVVRSSFVFSGRVGVTKILASGNLTLKTSDGERIWKGEFKPGFFKRADGVPSMAKKSAELFKKDWLASNGRKK
jgi:hypothetical protein